jgi:PhnB protein
MAAKVKAVPDGYHTITPHLIVNDGAKALDFYGKAFGAQERFRMPGPGGKVMHAEIQIGDSVLMLNDEFPEQGAKSPRSLGGSPVTIFLYVDDVDAWHKRAAAAGCATKMPPTDMFWGDRYCQLSDPFGHNWGIGTHKEDVAPADMEKRMAAAMGGK